MSYLALINEDANACNTTVILNSIIGPSGPQGDIGPTGYTGTTGQQGDIGPTGTTGQQGNIGPTGYTGTTGPQGNIGPTGIQGNPGISSGVIYYFNKDISATGIGGYYDMNRTISISTQTQLGPTSVSTTPVLLGSFITPSGDPNITSLPAGVWDFENYTEISSSGNIAYLITEIYNRNLAGTETLIVTNSSAPTVISPITSSLQQYTLAIPQTTILATDRIVVKFYGVMDAGTKDFTLYFNDNTIGLVTTNLSIVGAVGPTGPTGVIGATGAVGPTGTVLRNGVNYSNNLMWDGSSWVPNGTTGVAHGYNCNFTGAGTNSVSIGYQAGSINSGSNSVNIGKNANRTTSFLGGNDGTVNIGESALELGGGSANSINIGTLSGYNGSVGQDSINIGYKCGFHSGSAGHVGIGFEVGYTAALGTSSVCIGSRAGYTGCHDHSIILNAVGTALSSGGTYRCYIDPIRNSSSSSNYLFYDSTTKEVMYSTSSTGEIFCESIPWGNYTTDTLNNNASTYCSSFYVDFTSIATSITFYWLTFSSTNTYIASIWSDNKTTKQCETAAFTPTTGINTLTFTSNPSLTQGTRYWVQLRPSGNNGTSQIYANATNATNRSDFNVSDGSWSSAAVAFSGYTSTSNRIWFLLKS